MRIEIKTPNPVTDKDVKAIYMISAALDLLTDAMKVATLRFFADKFGFRLVEK